MKRLAQLSILACLFIFAGSVVAADKQCRSICCNSPVCWIAPEGGPCVEREEGKPGEFARQCRCNAADGHFCTEFLTHDGAMLAAFARADDTQIREGAARNRHTPAESLNVLAGDKIPRVRNAVAGNPNTPQKAQEQLASDPEAWVRKSLAGSTKSAELLQKLARDVDPEVRAEVALNPATPQAVLQTLAKDSDSRVPAYVARNKSTPPELLAVLASENLYNAESAAGNPSTPAAVLRKLAGHEDWHVRHQLATNQAAPPETMLALASDPEQNVYEYLLENPSITPEALAALVQKRCHFKRDSAFVPDDSWLCRRIAEHRKTQPATLAELVRLQPEDSGILQAAAANPHTPPSVLSQLILSNRGDVGLAAAANPSTPPDTLTTIALIFKKPMCYCGDVPKDACAPLPNCDSRLFHYVMRNPSLPIKTLEELAKSNNQSASEDAQKQLAERQREKKE